jgi:hypothetical protein
MPRLERDAQGLAATLPLFFDCSRCVQIVTCQRALLSDVPQYAIESMAAQDMASSTYVRCIQDVILDCVALVAIALKTLVETQFKPA